MNFKKPKASQVNFLPAWLPKPVQIFLLDQFKAKIIFNHKKCISCGHCLRSCPVKIINFDENKLPFYDKDKCISCFCCHEVCPEDAIDVKNPLLTNLFRR